MYGLIGGISIFAMVAAVVQNNVTHDLISDIIKNLAFGCVASTLVALLIEIGNIKEKNEKSDSIYDSVYCDLKCQILWYVETWASLWKNSANVKKPIEKSERQKGFTI